MKKNTYTTKVLSLIGLLLFTGVITKGQSLIDVAVSSNVFTPSAITINVGDTVRWTNVGGSHNVNGTTATFPSNPESFGNSLGSGWVYTHVFTIAGNYNYRCDPHFSLGMTGTIVVSTSTGIDNVELKDPFNIYPNPVTSELTFSVIPTFLTEIGEYTLAVYDVLGNQVIYNEKVSAAKLEVDVSSLPNSLYFYKILNDKNLIKAGRFIKK